MLRSLNSGVSGINQFQGKLDVIGNNISNASTTGYKKARADFEDAFSQTLKVPGPGGGSGVQVGSGVHTGAIRSIFNQGTVTPTYRDTDFAISGEGFFVGIAVAAYEWIAAIALIIIAVWFIPVYLKNKIYTMPQFLKTRYNETVALIMAVFWLFLYVFVNLTSILYLGAVAINGLVGGEYLHTIMIALA